MDIEKRKAIFAKIKGYIWSRKWIPYFELWIALPFFSVSTWLMSKRYKKMTIEYLSMEIRIYKWRFTVRLYDTWRRQS